MLGTALAGVMTTILAGSHGQRGKDVSKKEKNHEYEDHLSGACSWRLSRFSPSLRADFRLRKPRAALTRRHRYSSRQLRGAWSGLHWARGLSFRSRYAV